MKISGFGFVRNAIQFDYPIVEAITSILPICDEFVIAVGKSEDNTLNLIRAISSEKIKIIETVWDDSLRTGGQVLALETNKAFAAISPDADWAFYIQGDEIIHEKYLDAILKAAQQYKDEPDIEGLLFNYLHFYGSYRYVGDSKRWYRREIRMIRNDKNIASYKDAQGFRKKDDQKLKVKLIDAYVYHYGWVKNPLAQQKKQETFHKHWHDDEWMQKHIPKVSEFNYEEVDSLALFEGTHPQAMLRRVQEADWVFSYDVNQKRLTFKEKIVNWVEKLTGWRMGEYRNYKIV